ncbi:urea transporter [Flavobacterium sp. 245]|uniref:urea transporter n=1 Tax=Flavobacterium sp. 245 TaxID=2512115 RepID=UPI00105BF0C3|nr:urea transporter [Flavobacterium sp. 245]TDO94930.1 urea transporter [Flavobacterium sp. 245]
MESKISLYIKTILTSIGQIMLQENPWTGLLFLAGIFYGSPVMGIAALLSAVVGLFTAELLKFDKTEIAQGLYGFSATLVGVALTFFFKPEPVIWIAVIVGSALATIVQNIFIRYKIPAFTLPFILVTWICLFVFHNLFVIGSPAMGAETAADTNELVTVAHSFGEVIFQGSVLTGVIFILAVFINSPVAALYAIAAGVISTYLSLQFSEPQTDVHMGLFSFNAVLCAITFSGTRVKDGIYVFLSVVLSTLFDIYMVKMGWPALTFPFVLASWITILVKKIVPKQYQ